MGTIQDPKSGQRYVVPDDVVVDYVKPARAEVDLEPVTQSTSKAAAKRHSRRKVE